MVLEKDKFYNDLSIDKENDNVIYNDQQHVYIDKTDGSYYISVTTLIHNYTNMFDSAFWSAYKALESLTDDVTFAALKKVLLATKKFDLSILHKLSIDESQFNTKREEILQSYEDENWKDGLLKCHICGEYFPEETFHKTGKGTKKYHYRNNRDTRCPKCKANQNKIKRKDYSDKERLDSILLHRFHGAKDRAIKNNISFTLTLEDLHSLWDIQKGLCAVSKLPMTFNLDQGRIFTNVSIDKINPHLGYTKENIQLVCMAVNQMKSDMSLEELYTFCEAILKNK